MKPTGYIVFEHAEEFEQALKLDKSEGMPTGGVLNWRDKHEPATVFANRKDAATAITRTEHYRLAFATDHPERKFCKIVPIIPA